MGIRRASARLRGLRRSASAVGRCCCFPLPWIGFDIPQRRGCECAIPQRRAKGRQRRRRSLTAVAGLDRWRVAPACSRGRGSWGSSIRVYSASRSCWWLLLRPRLGFDPLQQRLDVFLPPQRLLCLQSPLLVRSNGQSTNTVPLPCSTEVQLGPLLVRWRR
ncbi:hypothetical protein BCR35DRAFT_305161 [Leucosporidium creatinivorum]|uniref:Uncharacterized protein n=1 Tax=Leucosporidium creatinivorum TaxID=106004 RepID=A0A1Y2F2D5_9BASI|nr:hypothetical protein BCR35DRAFT_305161 [Leucosporidium creatinivorum]